MLQGALAGLAAGGFYAIMAVCLTVMARLVRVVNFAQVAVGMFGAFAAVTISGTTVSPWIGAGIGLLTGAVISGVLGLIVPRWLSEADVRRARRRPSPLSCCSSPSLSSSSAPSRSRSARCSRERPSRSATSSSAKSRWCSSSWRSWRAARTLTWTPPRHPSARTQRASHDGRAHRHPIPRTHCGRVDRVPARSPRSPSWSSPPASPTTRSHCRWRSSRRPRLPWRAGSSASTSPLSAASCWDARGRSRSGRITHDRPVLRAVPLGIVALLLWMQRREVWDAAR